MQKKNPVIKNYILSPQKRVLGENLSTDLKKTIFFETLLYHSPSKQNMVYSFQPLLKK